MTFSAKKVIDSKNANKIYREDTVRSISLILRAATIINESIREILIIIYMKHTRI